eukprot:TRINITY_DN14521_c0_g3_i3.p1 TRINITY_DN14521_c0_g3~~TRINITY_DN14521_c0_g3_i3.p1  ORF type:complete len:412 (+),score=106.46 TRINITY_DN14521_c0_g3_i3:33-1268(+)
MVKIVFFTEVREGLSSLSEGLTDKQKLGIAVAIGAGVCVGATGIIVYQRLSENVSRSVGNRDIDKQLSSLSQTIESLRKDIESLKQGKSIEAPLKSALKQTSRYRTLELDPAGFVISNSKLERQEALDLPPVDRRRTLSQSSSFTTDSSSGTAYYSPVNSDEERLNIEEDDGTGGLLTRVDQLMEGQSHQQEEALTLLMDNKINHGQSADYLWRLCKAQHLMSLLAAREGDSKKKQDLVLAAVEDGKEALRLDELNGEAHKWFAIALGSRGEFGGVKEKILDGYEFKKHIDRAAELNPRDYIIHHLLGRFCYEVSKLSWLERKMAATLFAEPPSATLDEAVEHFLNAERMKPEGWKENRLFLGKCYIGLGDTGKGVEWLEKADQLPIVPHSSGIQDRISQEEIDKLLNKYR